jgi:hypothetical protein
MNLKVIDNFISEQEKEEIYHWAKSYEKPNVEIENCHIKEINDAINGFSVLCDLSKTEVSQCISKYQGDATTIEKVPDIIHELTKKISNELNLNSDNTFVQLIVMGKGGCVKPHYDAGMPNYITYKCNVCISSPKDDIIHVDKDKLIVNEKSLYCFEANLAKHWACKSESERIMLSYGFIVPYADLGWEADSPRVRLSNRIWKSFQN